MANKLERMGGASQERRLQSIMKLQRDFDLRKTLTVKQATYNLEYGTVSAKTIISYCKQADIPLYDNGQPVVPIKEGINTPKY